MESPTDQDYYSEVARASQQQLESRRQAACSQQQLHFHASDPQHKWPLHPQRILSMNAPPADALVHPQFGAAQPPHSAHLMLALTGQHLLAPSPASFLASGGPDDDYDDYAVPADESCCRLDRSQVELVQLIGEGQKGYVFLGKLQSRDGQTIVDVAIKTLKFETEQLIERLMNEAAMMKQLEHPHIIKFIGMCPETPALIAMELAHFGELKHYLQLNRAQIKCSQLVLFAFQISTALSYLESKNYVHRDVAARNVLVCSHNCVKLADFGLSRNLQQQQHSYNQHQLHPLSHHDHHDHHDHQHHQQHQQQQQQQQQRSTGQPANCARLLLASSEKQSPQAGGGALYVAAPRVKLPVRWLAPESLVFRRFTSASDVWMFAVFAWELFQFGVLRPWPELRNNQVLTVIEAGRRLTRPPACPERLYQLMLKCWSYAPVQRPKFREIKQSIWSVYLRERTREQLQFEEALEHERKQNEQPRNSLLMDTLPPQHQLTVWSNPVQVNSGAKLQQPASKARNLAPVTRHAPEGAASPSREPRPRFLRTGSRAGSRQPSCFESPEKASASTTDEEEGGDEDGSPMSPVSRLVVGAESRVELTSEALRQSQLNRFELRKSGGAAATAVEAKNEERDKGLARANNRRRQQQVHVLQKQRSQGTIGLTSADQNETLGGWLPTGEADARQRPNIRQGKLRQPFDDEALEHAKRQRNRAANLERDFSFVDRRLSGYFVYGVGDESSSSNSDEEVTVAGQRARFQQAATDASCKARPLTGAGRPLPISVSPALTATSEADGARSRMVPLEPAYEGVFAEQLNPDKGATGQGLQVSMLRESFLSPALTNCSPSVTPSRPVSWRSSPTPVGFAARADLSNNSNRLSPAQALLTQGSAVVSRPAAFDMVGRGPASPQPKARLTPIASNVNADAKNKPAQAKFTPAARPSAATKSRPLGAADQLGQLLQALRISPMKAKLKGSPEQNIRLLERGQAGKSRSAQVVDKQPGPTNETGPGALIAGDNISKRETAEFVLSAEEEQAKQFMLHQRLLGRIRPNQAAASVWSSSLSSSSSCSSAFKNNSISPTDLGRRGEQAADFGPPGRLTPSRLQAVGQARKVEQAKVSARQGNRPFGNNSQQSKNVHAVDHSLQILESLMSGEDGTGEQEAAAARRRRAPAAASKHTASLTRKSSRR